jgi:hypothetical protein
MHCYMLMPGGRTQEGAAANCRALGFTGLALWTNSYDQLDVEKYFTEQRTLAQTGYWLGVARKGTGMSYLSFEDGTAYDGTEGLQAWTHWSWRQPAAARTSDENCAAALNIDR